MPFEMLKLLKFTSFFILTFLLQVNQTPRKIMFTPGPLMTTDTVKQAMLRDIAVTDNEFKAAIDFSKRKLLEIAGRV